jgi:hypothetical protein
MVRSPAIILLFFIQNPKTLAPFQIFLVSPGGISFVEYFCKSKTCSKNPKGRVPRALGVGEWELA